MTVRHVKEVTGTFSGVSVSSPIMASQMHILMNFTGTASVDVETQMISGTWVKKEIAIVADYDMIYDLGDIVGSIRLNCTAHTDNVEYQIKGIARDRYHVGA